MSTEQQAIDADYLAQSVDMLCTQLADVAKQFTKLYQFGNFTAETRLLIQIQANAALIPSEHEHAAALIARMLHISTTPITKAGERPTNDQ